MRSFTSLVLAAVAVLVAGCPSCEDICRNDLDCDPDEGKFKCVGNVCQPTLPPATGDACDGDSDCTAIDPHLQCVDGACEFGPSCQYVADGVALNALVRSSTGEEVRGATVTRDAADGCAFTIEVDGAVSPTVILIDSIDTGTGAITATGCDRGRWSSSAPGGYLIDCGADDLDYVFGAPGQTLCYAADGTCPGETTCGFMSGFSGIDEGGFCE